MDILEKIIQELTKKFFEVEKELKDVKEKVTLYEVIVNSNVCEHVTEEKSTKSVNHEKDPDLEGEEAIAQKPKEKESSESEVNVKSIEKNQNHELKCEMCKYSCKKDSAMKKHMKTKHMEQKCKICEMVFPTSMDALKHTASEHCKHIKVNESVKNPAIRTNMISEEMDNFDITTKFRCYKCKNIVQLDDKFNESLEEDQMCKLCTMLQAYG